jgi:hypothetical protein
MSLIRSTFFYTALYAHRRTALHMTVLYGFTRIPVVLLEATEVDVTVIYESRQIPIDFAYEIEMVTILNVF